MPIMLNTLLTQGGLSLADVRLLRHQDVRAKRGSSPYELWRDNRPAFDEYQSTQGIKSRPKFANARYWACFLGTPDDLTLFGGLYTVSSRRLLDHDLISPTTGAVDKAGSCDLYDVTRSDLLDDFSGKLVIDWGPGMRAWVQRADKQDKRIIELRREFKEPDFPGFLDFIQPLSSMNKLPKGWETALKATGGVYLLTCPMTKEQYVGSATGGEGFFQRFLEYAETGHGGDVALKSRDPSDYQVSILEVAGSGATRDDIFAMETRWKYKLQSREMGLNRN
jgi:hypothetical protein